MAGSAVKQNEKSLLFSGGKMEDSGYGEQKCYNKSCWW
jgi:hypothetical protein